MKSSVLLGISFPSISIRQNSLYLLPPGPRPPLPKPRPPGPCIGPRCIGLCICPPRWCIGGLGLNNRLSNESPTTVPTTVVAVAAASVFLFVFCVLFELFTEVPQLGQKFAPLFNSVPQFCQ